MCEIPGADKLAAENKTLMRSPPQNDSRLTMSCEYRTDRTRRRNRPSTFPACPTHLRFKP
jgi:hypothetical protein